MVGGNVFNKCHLVWFQYGFEKNMIFNQLTYVKEERIINTKEYVLVFIPKIPVGTVDVDK